MPKYLGFKPSDEKRYFFVSYNSEDHERLKPIVKELSALLPL